MTWFDVLFWGGVVAVLYGYWLWDECRSAPLVGPHYDAPAWIVSPSGVELPLSGSIPAGDVIALVSEIADLPEVAHA